ncbi:uncharacterized protein BP01DRAFT_412883 [Aspergillus saccharolyticus JOP 1030-1]|uniref:Uncharacterized protein n=1 Tax=Aspergillus saccharolyticus JOP 1030-1 TaxID=1450539 RepID=A0A319A0W4_9EURO|nr:hypothetical protein BP01DRAFT_412883 [Aspergillus saccharolyticus JOP 1030-1]PYH50073.1 hypothetical protein BP01DRAFT_412883 [Aspergillus saccharolyticus JOP 1030-1]
MAPIAMSSSETRSQIPGLHNFLAVFSNLLLLGSDVIKHALAQYVDSRGFSPVVFSFDWVLYSVKALLSVAGGRRLMPKADCSCKVVNGTSGYMRDNTSGKLVELKGDDANAERPQQAGLVVSVYKPIGDEVGVVRQRRRDWIKRIAIGVVLIQLGLAFGSPLAFPGNVLAIKTGILPQWRETWACRRRGKDPYIVMRGNGAQHAIVVLGTGEGFNLEDLASGGVDVELDWETQIFLALYAVLWVALLITAAWFDSRNWFILIIGLVGTIQNVLAASMARTPEDYGIPLKFKTLYGEIGAMITLLAVEKHYRHIGQSMLGEFFPGKLKPEEERIGRISKPDASRRRVGLTLKTMEVRKT